MSCAPTRSSISAATSCPRASPAPAALTALAPAEQRTLNHIAAHQYLRIFGIVEEFILPFLLDHARPALRDDDWRVRALLQFAGEEAKHIQLFKRFREAFERGFPVECEMIGPSEAIGAEVLRHDPLAVGAGHPDDRMDDPAHYLGSIRDDGDLDPLFKSLMRHHWIEEAQHAKLDTLIVDALAEGRSEAEIDRAIDEFFEIGTFLDDGLQAQAGFNLDALETAIGRPLDDRDAIARAAAPGGALDLPRLGHGPPALRRHARGDLARAPRRASPKPPRCSPDTSSQQGGTNMIATVMNRLVNDLDLAALADIVDAIEQDPAKAKVAFGVTTRWTGQTRSESIVDGFTLGGERIARSHKIVADEPCQLLGTDSAPNPQELLMAAFNACITVGYVAGAALKGIELDQPRDRDPRRARPARLPRAQRRDRPGL